MEEDKLIEFIQKTKEQIKEVKVIIRNEAVISNNKKEKRKKKIKKNKIKKK